MTEEPVEQAQPVADAEMPEIDPARKALVNRWLSRIKAGEKKWKPVFDRMKADQKYVTQGGPDEWVKSGKFVVPIINRHINQAVASLYARNPKAKATVRERLYYQIWNEDPGSLQGDLQVMQTTGMPTPVIQEVVTVEQQKDMLKKVAKTLEILFNYYTSEQAANFKLQMKQLVRRTKTVGAGYLWLDFQRLMQKKPGVMEQITDITSKIAAAERLAQQIQGGKIEGEQPDVEQLRLSLQDIQNDADIIVREGPIFDFPRATEIVVDPNCRQLRGLIGAGWIARIVDMDPNEVQETFKVDIKQNYKQYTPDGVQKTEGDECSPKARVYYVYDKVNQQRCVVCDGYPDFLEEPATPKPLLERFWPIFVLTFNDVESEDEIFPPSDVHFLKPIQNDYNERKQGAKEHRRANRPKYAIPPGLEQTDKDKLEQHPANALIELKALLPGQKVSDILQPIQTVPFDPNLYETASCMDDLYRTVGTHEAVNGGTSGDTATEISVAESGRMASASSNSDDLDEFLSEVAHAAGQMMLMELTPETVTKIVGPGAAWPTLNRQQIAEDVELKIKAGSSGRPNRAAELANMERGMPFLIQIPGLNPNKLGAKYVDLLDLSDDDKEMFTPSLPSIVALNAMAGKQAQAATGDPNSDPNQQGAEGQNNAEAAGGNEPQSQPAYPAGDQPPGV